MGYQIKEITKNLSSQMPSFSPITGTTIDIGDLVPQVTESGKSLATGDYVIQVYGETGALQESFTWYLKDDTEDELTDGWFDKNGVTQSTRTFDVGEGFMMYSKKIGSVTYAGEVDGAQLELPVRKNLSHQGNPRAVSVSIQDLIPVVTESGKSLATGDYVIQVYGETGALVESFTWYLKDDTEDELTDGWFDKNGVTMATRTFAPGEGFMMYSKKTGKLVFPALSF